MNVFAFSSRCTSHPLTTKSSVTSKLLASLTIACLSVGPDLMLPSQSKAQTASPSSTRLSDAQVKARVDALLKEMTPEEKIGQMSQLFLFTKPDAKLEDRVASGQLGSLLFVTDPAVINHLQHVAVENSRLHIPLLFGFDVVHGFHTIFPVPIGMAASWDMDMIERAQTAAAKQARAVGIHWAFAPMVDIARDPRWGRIVEGAGADPYLGSAVAAAQVRGFQGSFLGADDHIVATAKHFAGYGAAEGGRDYDSVDLSDSQLWNVYLPPFKSAADAGAGSFMSAYMDLNGVPATGNRWLLHDVLRDDWKFKGFVVSDADAVNNLLTHGYAVDKADAAVRAVNAGVNMEMGVQQDAFDNLPSAYKAGKITLAQLDAAVHPILETKIRLGLFEKPYVDENRAEQILNAQEPKEESLRAAERSAVLLRNENGTLPLQPSTAQKVAVIGPLADSKRDINGPWVFVNKVDESVTVLDGLKQVAPQGTQFTYAQGVQIARKFPSMFDQIFGGDKTTAWTGERQKQEFEKAVETAREADKVVMVLGESQNMDGEAASSSTLELPGKQQELLEAVAATGKPIILVLLSARPIELRWASEHVPAILDAWYPGTEGGLAIANLLYGKAVPAGKLPYDWPRDVGQVPIFYSHDITHQPQKQGTRYWNEESTPLFPFGYGLSYTNFEFSNLRVSKDRIHKGDSVDVIVDLRNTGTLKADEVAQLYLHQKSGTSSRPIRELKGFQRLSLAPGEMKTLRFTLTRADLTYWSSATRNWVEDASQFDVWVGGDSNADLNGSFGVEP
jgi:beta-glucosidase